MASIGNDPNGRRRILFVAPDGKRKTVRLGKMSKRQAEAVKIRIEHLVATRISKSAPDDETSRWVAELDDVLYDRLAAVGLVAERDSTTLGAFIDRYIESRTDVKPATNYKYENTRRKLVEFFGENRPLRDISPGDGEEWRLHLLDEGLVENTVRKNTGIAKVFFNAAVRRCLIPANPFADLVSAVRASVEKFHVVRCPDADKIIEACPNAQWRLIFALSRYGGLRCPSEHLSLRWGDIHWDRGRMTVWSPKTEHHPNGESRLTPLFPELRPYLEAAFDEADEGTEYVITRYRDSEVNLRTQLLRIIAKAGLEPWPKLFQNLRSTRETELAETFPMHVVCAWLGNSQPVAAKHYLQSR